MIKMIFSSESSLQRFTRRMSLMLAQNQKFAWSDERPKV
ncbi:hypothetical protein PANA5342_3287 [Pantoea ananatis LMG 5342]|nr:hypothetical protein PANA5342_3287 [Pantoea ananatis LMG 5342]